MIFLKSPLVRRPSTSVGTKQSYGKEILYFQSKGPTLFIGKIIRYRPRHVFIFVQTSKLIMQILIVQI